MTDETTELSSATAAAPEKEATETSALQTDSTAIETTGGAPAPAPKKESFEKRIGELTWRFREEQRARERAEQLLQDFATKRTPPEAEVPQGKPTLEQFEYDQERYLDALADWKLSEREKAAEAKRKETEAKQTAEKRTQTFAERANAAAAKYEDYNSVAHDPTLPVSTAMAETILEAEEGPEILYYLGQHRDEAARIAQLNPASAAIALGKIAARLTAPPPPPEKQISTAPEPIKTVKPTSSAPKGLSDEMSVNDWVKLRNKQDPRFKRG